MKTVLSVSNLTKTYLLHKNRQLLAAQPFRLFDKSKRGELLYAVKDVSFEVEKGEIFGIIGHNGSGKSTLLKVLSGITKPDKGSFQAKGHVTSLLELGVGFEPELSGRENLYLYGSLIGLSRDIIAEKEEVIIDFSGIREFIDLPIKTYSSGMLIRLAFATAINTDPDVLLLDEVLGVGDNEFRHRSFQAIQKAVERGVAVLIVSHGLSLIGSFCSRVMCLQQGQIVALGPAESVVQTYMDTISTRGKICEIEKGQTRLRFLSGGFQIENAGKVLTVVRGCSINLKKWDADFLSSEAAFKVLDLEKDKVKIQLNWGHWNLQQIWSVSLSDENTIDWKIENGSNLYEEIDSVELEVIVSSAYKSYVLPEGFRDFPETVNRGFNMEYLLFQKQPRRFLGAADSDDNRRSVLVDFSDSPMTGLSMVISGANVMPGRILKRAFAAEPGKNTITAKIHLFTTDELMDFFQSSRHPLRVTSGQLRLELIDNHLMLSLKDKQLTRLPGLHVAWIGDHADLFYDWEIIDTDDGLILRATCQELPVVVVWTLKGNGTGIYWQIFLEILEDIANIKPQIQAIINEEDLIKLEFSPNYNIADNKIVLSAAFLPDSFTGRPSRIHLGSGIIRLKEDVNG